MRADYVTDYANKVLDGKIIAGPSVRAACRRHLRDIDIAGDKGWKFDLPAANKVFGFFEECLFLKDGQFDGLPFRLQPPQKFILGSLFGWKIADGTRRFRTFYGEMGKGSGKSPLSGGVGLYCLTADDEPSAEVYFGAPTKDQAKVAFNDCVGFVDRNPDLAAVLRKVGENPVEALKYPELDGEMKPVSSDGKKKSGFRPSLVIVDEVHELGRDDQLIVMLRKGFKSRRNPLLFMITNSGYDKLSICWREHERGQKVLAGVDLGDEEDEEFKAAADATFVFICDLDAGDDPLKDETCWPKANPMLDVIVPKRQLRLEVSEAKLKPDEINDLLRLNFCVWTSARASWMSRELWESCETEFTHDEILELEGALCFGGLDLSMKNDLTALVLVFPTADGRFKVMSWFFAPRIGLKDRCKRDGVPYDRWADEGHLILTDGPIVDYSVLAKKLLSLDEQYEIKWVAFDPYKIDDLRRECTKIQCKIELKEHGQSARMTRQTGFWMPGSISALEEAILTGKMRINSNPVLTMCAMSAESRTVDDQGNRLFCKQKSTRRIDGVVALAMAMGAYGKSLGQKKRRSIYEQIAEQRKAEESADAPQSA